MATFWASLGLLLLVFYLLVVARLIVEFTRSFARSWRPAGVAAIGLEVVYSITDPPMKLLRRLIPPLRVGGMSIDVSVIVLFVIIYILQQIVGSLATSAYGPAR
ncbi:YggT family protein [Jatrophihabitans telluris]|uniref:YggT family protein n=1 Tax=Jatrophihabitans telluris TaxID=2038343 RepID=A0ABY4QU59_9ACTN|nr:YggT family protein [Jatrophihabitans telluris]UQX87183.1 YggT family protein [Jatrophihabitans telluris]